jgi:hypothetical protein
MTSSDPMDLVNLQILDLLSQRIGIRQIGKAIGMSHIAVRNRILRALLPSGLVIKDATGNYQIIRSAFEAFMKESNQNRGETSFAERNSATGNLLHSFSGSIVNGSDQTGDAIINKRGKNDPFPGKTRIHNLRYKIPLKNTLNLEQLTMPVSMKNYPANIVKMSNWYKIDLTFQNFRAFVTTKSCIIYGIKATGSHFDETIDILDRAWQLVEPDLDKLENILRRLHPKIKFRRDDKGIIVAEILTMEIADEQDQGAIYMLRNRPYYVVREPHTGKLKFVLDRSTGLPEVEAVDPVTGINDYENLRNFKMSLGPVAYNNLMLAVSRGYDPVKEIFFLRQEMDSILLLLKQIKETVDCLIKGNSMSQVKIN